MQQPDDKCVHGVYKGTEPVALFCGACNPTANQDRPLRLAMARKKPLNRVYPEPHTMDAADFMRQNPNTRIDAGREFITLGDCL